MRGPTTSLSKSKTKAWIILTDEFLRSKAVGLEKVVTKTLSIKKIEQTRKWTAHYETTFAKENKNTRMPKKISQLFRIFPSAIMDWVSKLSAFSDRRVPAVTRSTSDSRGAGISSALGCGVWGQEAGGMREKLVQGGGGR